MKTSLPLVVAALLGLFSNPGRAIEMPPQIKQLDRFVAIDGACGWPQLTVFPNGELAALIWPYPNHGHHEGASECWTSSDGGLIWRKASVPVKNEPGVARLNLAAGRTETGAYVALIGGFAEKPPVSGAATYKAPAILINPTAPIPAISADQGRTWVNHPAPLFRQSNGRNLVPYGRIAPLGKDELGVMCYLDEVLFYASTDGGITWKERGLVAKGKVHNETTWLRLANGELYAAARTWDDGHVDGLRSSDGGVTWRSEGALTLPRQHPADLIHLPDGRVLMSYGIRNQGFWGICVRVADAEARNWSEPALLVNMEDATDMVDGGLRKDGGYPSTVVLRDGTLVTAYYSRGIPAHRRYHMAVVRWTLMGSAVKVQGKGAGN